MSCNNNILCQGHQAQVYRGETIVGDFTLYDDSNQVVTEVDEVVVLLTDRSGEKSPLVKKLSTGGVTYSDGNLRFVVSTSECESLPDKVNIEIKVIVNGLTRIATRQLLTVVDNIVKDY